tara:strand:+ start:6 stop:248 length:243 start_codon:yes stop_codon:yes gene_type:complete
MTLPSNPTDITLIKHLYETLALKDVLILNLQEGIHLSHKCQQQLQSQLKELHNSSKETQLKTAILIRKIRELEEINEKKH